MEEKLPSNVYAAICILWIETAISFIYGLYKFDDALITIEAFLFILFVYGLIVYWITGKLADGRNWMRVFYTVIYVLAILIPVVVQIFGYLNGGISKFDAATFAHQLTSTLVIYLLYSGNSKQHFSKQA